MDINVCSSGMKCSGLLEDCLQRYRIHFLGLDVIDIECSYHQSKVFLEIRSICYVNKMHAVINNLTN